MNYHRHEFRAMGTSISLLAPEADASTLARAQENVESVFAREEDRFSRFKETSELTQVNKRAGRWVDVSPRFEEVVRLAIGHAESTGGLFDPTVLDAVIAAGYDRDFDEVLAGARGALHPSRPCGRWTQVEVSRGAIRLPADVGLDLGGIAKGFTSDLAAEAATRAGLPWALVSAGGDLRLFGEAPPIEVAIEDPADSSTCAARVTLRQGALATSSVMARAWGDGLHHVIDPRTGAPSRTDAIQATVWAPTCAEAEVLATWALLTGHDATRVLPCAIATVEGDLVMSFNEEVAA
jgi:Membrane-associated lipoprotein involved in thiamine biosynthesis